MGMVFNPHGVGMLLAMVVLQTFNSYGVVDMPKRHAGVSCFEGRIQFRARGIGLELLTVFPIAWGSSFATQIGVERL